MLLVLERLCVDRRQRRAAATAAAVTRSSTRQLSTRCKRLTGTPFSFSAAVAFFPLLASSGEPFGPLLTGRVAPPDSISAISASSAASSTQITRNDESSALCLCFCINSTCAPSSPAYSSRGQEFTLENAKGLWAGSG